MRRLTRRVLSQPAARVIGSAHAAAPCSSLAHFATSASTPVTPVSHATSSAQASAAARSSVPSMLRAPARARVAAWSSMSHSAVRSRRFFANEAKATAEGDAAAAGEAVLDVQAETVTQTAGWTNITSRDQVRDKVAALASGAGVSTEPSTVVDRTAKFKLLQPLLAEFGVDIPQLELGTIQTVDGVIDGVWGAVQRARAAAEAAARPAFLPPGMTELPSNVTIERFVKSKAKRQKDVTPEYRAKMERKRRERSGEAVLQNPTPTQDPNAPPQPLPKQPAGARRRKRAAAAAE